MTYTKSMINYNGELSHSCADAAVTSNKTKP